MTISNTRIDRILFDPECTFIDSDGVVELYSFGPAKLEIEPMKDRVEKRLFDAEGDLEEIDTVWVGSNVVMTEQKLTYERRKVEEELEKQRIEEEVERRRFREISREKYARLEALRKEADRLFARVKESQEKMEEVIKERDELIGELEKE